MAERLLVSTRKGLFEVERHAQGRWTIGRHSFQGDNVSLALPDGQAWYAALDHGHFGAKLQRSEDQGRTWTEAGTPAYPEPPEGHVERDTMGREIPWRLLRIWALEAGGAPGELWAGSLPGGLFHSTDRGETWELVRSLWDHPGRREWMGGGADYPGIHTVSVDPRNGDRVLVAVSCGGAWFTEDRGRTWECRGAGMWAAYMPPDRARDPGIQDIHRIARCPADPDALWAQHHNGVFRSTDEGLHWEEFGHVPPSVFGFPVVVHPRDPRTAWFVPAVKDEQRIPAGGSVSVARTRDGGASFERLTAGLPQEHAYDLVYRHALDVDGSGERLAFGSTTGSLWITEDGGDHWLTVSEHLPPIHAVRFVEDRP